MHGRRFFNRAAIAMALLSVSLVLSACASAPPPNVNGVDCQAKSIEWEVAKSAEILKFSCAMGKQGMDPALIYTVELKNVTDKPLRYRVNIFLLDMDKAAGALVPRKGKPPAVAPGETASVKIPFIKTTAMPAKMLVRVAPLSE